MNTKRNRVTTAKKAASIAKDLAITMPENKEPEDFLYDVMMGKLTDDLTLIDGKLRLDAAKALLQAKVRREGQLQIRKNQGLGKKEALANATKEIMGGKEASGWSSLLKPSQVN